MIVYSPVVLYEAESDFDVIQSRRSFETLVNFTSLKILSVEEMDLKFGDFS